MLEQASKLQPSENSLMISLANCLAGDFSNKKQALDNPKEFAHIRVFFRPLPFEFFGGIGFYSEQTYDYDLWTPYRQGIHRFVSTPNQVIVENYSLKDAYLYAGSGHNQDILNTIKPDFIERRYNCSMVFRKEENIFRGEVEGKSCFINRNGQQTYLISEVELTETTFVSWDRGMDIETNQQVWGSTHGPLRFEKKESFAGELPQVTD